MEQPKKNEDIKINHGILPDDIEELNTEAEQQQDASLEKPEKQDPNRPFEKPEIDQLDHLFNIIGEPTNATNYITRKKEVREAILRANIDPNDKDVIAKRKALADEIFKIADEDYDNAK
jgi:hypothetical protein